MRRSQTDAAVSRADGASLGSAAGPRAASGALLAAAAATVLALAVPARVSAQSIPVGVGGAMSALVGATIDVPITVDMSQRTEKLGSFALRISWDPAVLGFVGGIPGSFGSATVNEDSATHGVLHLAGANAAGAGGVVTLGVGHFTVLSAANSPFTLTLTELFAAGAPFADLLPSAVVTSGSFCAAEGRYGDLDNNGLANSFDALVALSNAVGLDVSAYDIALGDVDANGVTNARDALIVLSSAVGLDVSAFRVLRIAGGACTSGTPGAIALTPAAVGSLLVGQTVGFEARSQGAGGLQTLTDLTWSSSNAAVLQVAGDGSATALAAGTADVIAVRDGRDTARLAVTVVARRTMHVVDAAAANTANGIGTPELPFALIGDATAIAQDGDTIFVKPGRYAEGVTLSVDALLLGDTLADGTRPLIAPAGGVQGAGGVLFDGSGARRITNIAFQDLVTAVDVQGPSRLELVGVRASNVWYGVTVGSNLTALLVRRSVLTGGGLNGPAGDGVYAYAATLDTVLIEDSEIGDFDGEGLYLGEYGLLTVQRSLIRDVYDALYAGYGETRSGGALLLQNRIERVGGAYVRIANADSVRLRGNIITGGNCGDCIWVDEVGFTAMTGDSIESGPNAYDWIYAYYGDSVVVDSLHASLGYAVGYLYSVPLVRLTNSRFHNVSEDVLDVYGSPGGRLVVDSVTMSGDPSCYLCGAGVYTVSNTATISRLGIFALGFGVESSGDSSVSVTNSTFRGVETGVSWNGYSARPGGLTVTRSLFEDFSDEGVSSSGAAVVDSNTFVGGQYATAVDLSAAETMSVTRNRISDTYTGISLAAFDSARTHTVADNVVSAWNYAVQVTGDYSAANTLGVRFSVARNSLMCLQSGGFGVSAQEADAVVSDNAVQGCDHAMYLYGTNFDPLTTRTDSVLRNTVQLGPTVQAGIAVLDNVRSVVSGNTATGDTTGAPYSYGAIWVGASGTCVTYGTCQIVTRIDSNTVTGVPALGIYLSGADSVSLAGNTINDVGSRGGTPVGYAGVGIAAYGAFRGSLGLAGNAVRRAARSGVYLVNTDTATLRVDSSLFNGNHIGLDFYQGGAILTRNRIASSDTGVIYGPSAYGSFTSNNIVGNRMMGVVSQESAIDGANNWWGDPLGPRCVTSCAPGSAGDSISQSGVLFSPPLTAEFGATPPLSVPPLRVLAALRAAPSAFALPAGPRSLTARRTGMARAARLPQAVVALRPSVLPSGLSPAMAQRLGERLARRAEGLARRSEALRTWQSRLQTAAQEREAAQRRIAEQRSTRQRAVEEQRRAAPPAAPAVGRQP